MKKLSKISVKVYFEKNLLESVDGLNLAKLVACGQPSLEFRDLDRDVSIMSIKGRICAALYRYYK